MLLRLQKCGPIYFRLTEKGLKALILLDALSRCLLTRIPPSGGEIPRAIAAVDDTSLCQNLGNPLHEMCTKTVSSLTITSGTK